MSLFIQFLTIALIHLLAVMSPGPDFILVSQHSLIHSRRSAIYTSAGLALGILVHVTYSLIGIGVLISTSLVLFTIIKILGGGYLILIGYRALTSPRPDKTAQTAQPSTDLPPWVALRTGFLTNILNPKVTLFFLSVFTQIIDPHTPLVIQALSGLEMSFMTFVWFSAVACLFSHNSIKKHVMVIQYRLEKIFGIVLIALGVRVALSTQE